MLETKCVGNNFKMLVMVLASLVTNIQKMSEKSKFSHQHPKIVANFKFQHYDIIISLSPFLDWALMHNLKLIFTVTDFWNSGKFKFLLQFLFKLFLLLQVLTWFYKKKSQDSSQEPKMSSWTPAKMISRSSENWHFAAKLEPKTVFMA